MTALEPEMGQPVDLSSTFAPELPQPIAVTPTLTPDQITANLNGTTAPTGQPARDATAIIPNLPDTQGAFVRKYQRLGPMLANVPSKTRATLIQMDWERAQKGQAPLSEKQTLAALIQAAQDEQLTKKESGDGGLLDTLVDIPGNAVKDVGLILKSIPQLPGALVNEVTSLDDFGKIMAENQAAGMNPLAALLNAPGVRMIPGSYVAGNLARGTEGLKELAAHPTITALDVLPYAGKLAAGTKVAKQAAIETGARTLQTAENVAAAAGKDPAALRAALEQMAEESGRRAMRGARPLRPVLTKKLLPEGMVDPVTQSRLTPNALGRVTEKAAKSSVGQMLNEAFGPMARDTGAAAMIANEQLQRVYSTEMPTRTALEATARRADDLYLNASERFGVSADDRARLTELAEQGEAGWMERLPTNEKAFIDEAQAIRRQVESEAIARGLGDIVDGEYRNAPQAKLITRLRSRYDRALGKFQEGKGAKMAALAEEYRAGLYGPDEGVPVLDRVGEGVKLRAVEKVEELARVLDEAADPNSPTTWADALNVINARMQGRTNIGSPSQVGGQLRNAPQATDRLGTLASLRDEVRKLKNIERIKSKAEAAVPDRFIPRVQKEGLELARTRLIEAGQDPAEAARLVTDANYRTAAPELRRIVDKSVAEMAGTWQKMRAAGHDPMWVHRVTQGREGSVIRPQISGRAISPSIGKARTVGADPIYYKDIAVGLDHAAFEMLRNEVTGGMTDYISKAHGMAEADLLARYEAAGVAKAASNPYLEPRGWAQEAMRRDWVPFDPTKYGGFASDAPVMIPKVVAKSLDRMFNPHPTGILNSAVFDKTTGLFRTSVLALSPRWHIYNVVGGAIMLGAEDLRAFSPSNISKSLKVLKAARNGEQVLPDRMQFALGSTMKELDADRASILAGADEASKLRQLAETRPGQAAAAFVKGSYKLNGFADDVYRVMSYLNGEKQALAKGIDDVAAQEIAMESVRRTSQVWVELSPFERQVLRKVFPFYSFTAKIMKLVTQYPFDHPVRAAVMANIAEAELADMGDAMPTDWLSTTGIGGENEKGDQTRLSWRGLNPFNDVGDMFTFAGFLQGMNPLIATAGEQLAGDPYAEKVYNPETGKLEQPKPNLLRSLISNTVPQAGAALALTGMDKSMADLQRTNPEAYQRMIASGFGVPTGFRTYNKAETKIMAELNRQTTQREAWAAFLRSGDTTEVEKYPALRPLIPIVQRLRESGQLQAYNPIAGAQPGASGAVTAIASQAPWPT